jgi:hypothetical protein
MPCPLLNLGGDLAQPPVEEATPTSRRRRIERCGIERMRKPDTIPHKLDQLRTLRLLERRRRIAAQRLREKSPCRLTHTRRDKQRLPRFGRQATNPSSDETAEILRHRQRITRRYASVYHLTSDLEPEKWISAARLVDTQKQRPRQRPAEPTLQQLVDRGQTKRLEPETGRPRDLQTITRPARRWPLRCEQTDSLAPHPPERERERAHGWPIEPLHIVNRNEHRAISGQTDQDGAKGRRNCPRLNPRIFGLRPKKRNLKRMPLRTRKHIK